MNVAPIAELKQVKKHYGEGPQRLDVLTEINLNIEAGEAVAVVGPSGCGKSTLLNLLGALDRPSDGEISIGGQNLDELNETQVAGLRNDKIGFVFQSHHLLPQLNVLENVLMPSYVHPEYKGDQATVERAQELIERVGLTARMDHLPGQLSGGERQRVALIRALINEPGMLLADEPTGALDQSTAQEIAELLLQMNQEKKTALIMVTHAPDLASQMQRTLRLDKGRLID